MSDEKLHELIKSKITEFEYRNDNDDDEEEDEVEEELY